MMTGHRRFFEEEDDDEEECRRDRLKSRPAGMARTRVVPHEIGRKNVVLASQRSSRISGHVGLAVRGKTVG